MNEFGEMNTRDYERDGTNRSIRRYTVLYNRPYVSFPELFVQIQISQTRHTNLGSKSYTNRKPVSSLISDVDFLPNPFASVGGKYVQRAGGLLQLATGSCT
jgi:hypothetical protein